MFSLFIFLDGFNQLIGEEADAEVGDEERYGPIAGEISPDRKRNRDIFHNNT